MSNLKINDKSFTIMDYSTPIYICAKFSDAESFHEFFDTIATEDVMDYEVTIGRSKTSMSEMRFGMMDIVHEDGEITANTTMRELTDPEKIQIYIDEIKNGTLAQHYE